SGCVSKSVYLKQVSATDQAKSENAELQKQLVAASQLGMTLKKDLDAEKADNATLLSTLDAKKGELNQRVSELSKQNLDMLRAMRENEQAKQAEIDKLK